MNTIAQCPWCDEPLDEPVDTDVENAESFCRKCSAPLFWAPTRRAPRPAAEPEPITEVATPDPTTDPSHRLPELKGVRSAASVPCWQCLEPNQQVASDCHRCGAPIPPPVVEPAQATTVPLCGATGGATTRPPIEFPAWGLIVLGVVLVALIVGLIEQVW